MILDQVCADPLDQICALTLDQTVTLTAPTAGAESIGGATSSSLSVSCAAATGGSGSFSYQWYRSTSSGFTPGAGNLLAGNTSLAFTDSGLAAATTYYYVCVTTDTATSLTASSTQASGTTSSGAATIALSAPCLQVGMCIGL